MMRLLSSLLLIVTISVCLASNLRDNHPKCKEWADMGECEANSGYMLVHCEESCYKMTQHDNHISHITSFFDLKAKDIDGNTLDFETLRGKATIVVNVASYCGYTESHYRGLVELHKELVDTEMVEILAFPCNQFGAQEPAECSEIKEFAQMKGVEFTMMDKIEVNGPETHDVYKFLKKIAGPSLIGWNFATYYVISPDGTVQSFSGVEPHQLKDTIMDLIEQEL